MNILFKKSITDLKAEDKLALPTYPVVGFGNSRVVPLGAITLPISFMNGARVVNVRGDFLVVDTPTTYDGIIGRPLTHTVNAFPCSYHQLMFFRTPGEAGVIHGDQTTSRELMRIEYNRHIK